MKNITASVPDDVYRAAGVHAAERSSSVGALVTEPLRSLSEATLQRFGISYWDAAIIEAGRVLGCELVLSEDLSDGADHGGIRVENPFRDLA